MALGNNPFDLGNDPLSDPLAATALSHDWEYAFAGAYFNIDTQETDVSAESTQYIHVQTTAYDVATHTLQDPTTTTASLAFTAGTSPLATSWVPAAWFVRTVDNTTWARALIGPGGYPTPTGVVSVFVQIFDGTETIVKLVGTITVQ